MAILVYFLHDNILTILTFNTIRKVSCCNLDSFKIRSVKKWITL